MTSQHARHWTRDELLIELDHRWQPYPVRLRQWPDSLRNQPRRVVDMGPGALCQLAESLERIGHHVIDGDNIFSINATASLSSL